MNSHRVTIIGNRLHILFFFQYRIKQDAIEDLIVLIISFLSVKYQLQWLISNKKKRIFAFNREKKMTKFVMHVKLCV